MKPAICLLLAGAVSASLPGCATSRGPRHLDTSEDDPASWARVRQLAASAEIAVQMRGGPPGQRHFVSADENALLVLNLTDPVLPPAASRTLRSMAARAPQNVVSVMTGGALAENDVRIGRDGLFVSNRRVADLDDILERIAASDVVEIRGPVVARGSVLGAIIGGWLGFSIGAVPALGGAEEGVAWFALIGSTALGGYLGHRWSSRNTEGVVYRAP
jgi:hypothetical protein